MRQALEEARKGVGFTSPNPAVGAVIISKAGRLLSRGYHRMAGLPHAEIEALRELRHPESARGATMFVTLEPCSTHGRTPPCVDAIVNAGIKRVVIGATDPNPAHAGRGVRILQKADLEVRTGVLAAECAKLNQAFNKWIVTGLPLVTAKAALSLDGRLIRPPGEEQWLTSAESRLDAQRLRATVDAILVGAGTVRADNPRLTVRDIAGARQPLRVVISHTGDIPGNARLLTDAHRSRTLIYRRSQGSSQIEVFEGSLSQPARAFAWAGKSMLQGVLRNLGKRDVTHVMIEGGLRVLSDAFDAKLVDRVHFYFAPLLCGGPAFGIGGRGAAATAKAPRITGPEYVRIGDDIRLTGGVVWPWAG